MAWSSPAALSTPRGLIRAVEKDAHVEGGVHAELGELLVQRNDALVVGIPSARDQLHAPQAELMIAALRLRDHQLAGALERAAGEPRGGIEHAEAEQRLSWPGACARRVSSGAPRAAARLISLAEACSRLAAERMPPQPRSPWLAVCG